jgi:hypothetical protein
MLKLLCTKTKIGWPNLLNDLPAASLGTLQAAPLHMIRVFRVDSRLIFFGWNWVLG